MALILRFLPNLVVSGAHGVKVVDKAITMDNLRLLCLVVSVCRGNTRLHGINNLKLQGGLYQIHKIQDLMRSTWLAIV